MTERRTLNRFALEEFVMRYAPAAFALSLLVAVTSSVSFGATHEPDPRAAALVAEGRAEMKAGKVEDAITTFEAALAIDPAHVAIYHDLAAAARQQGMQGKAIHYYRTALARNPEDLAALAGEGQALLEKGAVEKARRNLGQLQTICGSNCAETRELAAAIESAPKPTVLTAEAVLPDAAVTQN
ncbi:MAG: tetratricopeptide repeat protein [Croceibacterium sp.]